MKSSTGMTIKTETMFTHQHNDTTIALYYIKGESWEVYYRKPHYAFMFAFGLPATESIGTVLEIAIANIEEYGSMFE